MRGGAGPPRQRQQQRLSLQASLASTRISTLRPPGSSGPWRERSSGRRSDSDGKSSASLVLLTRRAVPRASARPPRLRVESPAVEAHSATSRLRVERVAVAACTLIPRLASLARNDNERASLARNDKEGASLARNDEEGASLARNDGGAPPIFSAEC
jgi:hypothetical protein